MAEPANDRQDLARLTERHTLPSSLRETSGMQRLNAILELTHPSEFVQDLATQDLYLLLHDIGKTDAFVLLEYASNDQFRELMALDTWSRDEFQIDRWINLLDLAKACNWNTALRFIKSTESELIQLILSGDIQVHDKDLDIETVPDFLQVINSPDFMFKFTVPRGHDLEGRLPELLKMFWAEDEDRIRKLCVATRFELSATLQESMYRLRNGQLADMGLASTEDAAELYELLHPKSVRNEVRSQLDDWLGMPALDGRSTGFDLILRDIRPPNFLAHALAQLDDDTRARFGTGFAALASKAFVARTGDHSHLSELPEATTYAAGLVNLGLSYLCDERASVAPKVLEKSWPETLFRVGHSLTMEYGLKARRVRLRSGLNRGLYPFGFPVDDMLEAVAMPQPMFFEGLERTGNHTLRPFRTPADLDLVKTRLDQVEAVLGFFEEKLGYSPEALLSLSSLGLDSDVLRSTRLASLFRTGLAQMALTDAFAFKPLTKDDLTAFLKLAIASPASFSAPVTQAIETLKESTSDEVDRWIDKSMDELLAALGRVSLGELEPQYAAELFLVVPE